MNTMKTITGDYCKKTQYLTYEIDGKEFWAQGEFETRDTENGYDILHWHDDDTLVTAHVEF